MGQTTPDHTPDIIADQQIKIARYFFDLFCDEHKVTDDMRRQVNQIAYAQWLAAHAATFEHTVESLMEECNTNHDTTEMMLRLAQAGDIQHIVALWPFMTLSHRENKNPVRSINLLVAVQWEDGTVAPLNMLAHRLTQPSGKITDADTVHLIVVNTPTTADQIAQVGLDKLHDAYAPKLKGVANAEVLGLLREALQNHPGDDSGLTTRAATLIGFFEQLFPADLPEHIVAAIAASKVKQQTPGGFDA